MNTLKFYRKILFILFILILHSLKNNLKAQTVSELQNTYSYRDQQNPYYWKNRLPYAGYWQQDVGYTIRANLNDATDIIDANLDLEYWNNSPDTLTFVYFHLYQNAFQPGSYYDDLVKNNGGHPKWGKYESQKSGTLIENLKITDNKISYDAKSELDNTILKVYLQHPLMPDQKINFAIKFKTYFDSGSERRRMKKFIANGFKHYDGGHWYPRICVYDKKFGWDTNQHLGREFYGDYGSYDVALTFPNNYIVEATGVLQNKNEVLPDSLRNKLDVKNFASKPFNSVPSVIITPDGTTKTWKYRAINVHDFAWTADPTYRIAETMWQGIQCIGLVQESHASGWQNSAEYTAKIIKIYSEDFGMYAYPKMVVADARDGMEYPMLTLDGGTDPGYRVVIAHEIGHNWFFGMVGNNETYRAFMDEGFTQFLNTWANDKTDPDGLPVKYKSNYQKNFKEQTSARYNNNYYSYLNAAIKGEDGFINTHSDMFNGALAHGGGYSMVYRKTGTMLYNLQYVLGDSLFLKAMQHYFNQWKMCHPYPEDFRQSIISFTKVDLNWFFDQWMETDKHIDYKICSVKKTDQQNVYKITFERKDRMQMPIDFSVYSKSGLKYDFYIPNTWFVKQTDATVLPKWFGWDNIQPTYTAEVKIPDGISNIEIDPTNRLADINMLNNSKVFPSTLKFDSKISNLPDWLNYEMKVRPDIWYNSYDGFKAGVHLEGQYMNYKHVFSFDTYVNTGIAQGKFEQPIQRTAFDPMSYQAKYRTPIFEKYFKNLFVNLGAKSMDGLNEYKGGLDFYSFNRQTKVFGIFKSMHRKNTTDLDYLLYPDEWLSSQFNNTFTFGIEKNYKIKSISCQTIFSLESSSIGSAYNYSKIILSNTSKTSFSKFDFSARIFAQYGTGDKTASESALFLAGANPEELMEDKFTRSRGFVPLDWLGYSTATNHFQQGGGLNLRGYAGYVAPESVNSETRSTYKGTSGAAINLELNFDRFFNFKPSFTKNWLKFNSYLFTDAGLINENTAQENLKFGSFRMDAGIGSTLTIKKFGSLETVNPFTIRFDMPLFLNHPPFEENDYFKFRYVVGISRCF